MKITKLMLYLLFAGLMMAFTACSSDDDKSEPTPNAPKPKVEKRLVQMNGFGKTIDITYNADGLIKEVRKRTPNQGVVSTNTYTYSPSKITVPENYYPTESVSEATYWLDNGLITKMQDYLILGDGSEVKTMDVTYSYTDGRISKWEMENGAYRTFQWKDGDIVKTTTKWSDDSPISVTYRYSERIDYGRFIGAMNPDMLGGYLDPYLVMQGFFGTMPLHLLQNEDNPNGTYNHTWTYEFDEDGYPFRFTMYNDDWEYGTSTLAWEICD